MSTPTRSESKCHGQDKRQILVDLFPPLEPYDNGFIAVDDIHNIYWEQSGNPNGVPILVLHGGPGTGASTTARQFFDPDHYRIIIFDQRGAGRSTPRGCLINNTTSLLLEDIETLRQHLNVDRWHLFGGSWGSTLAIKYAIAYPAHCISMTLRGIFLCEQGEIDWFLYGMQKVFPEAWEQFASLAPEDQRDNLLEFYYGLLTGDDHAAQMDAAICWALYEGACASLVPNYEIIVTEEQKQRALAIARLEAHYFKHEVICGEERIMQHIDKIRHIPTMIVQGRYDIICPLETAYKLHQAWPEAEYVAVADAGHSADDPSLRSQLVESTEHFKHLR